MSGAIQKIVVQNPVVELDGDEMTRIIWKKIREEVRDPWFCYYRFVLDRIALSSFSHTSTWTSNTTIWDWSTEMR